MNERRELCTAITGAITQRCEKAAELVADLEPLLSGKLCLRCHRRLGGAGRVQAHRHRSLCRRLRHPFSRRRLLGEVDAVIELGGEDAKIPFLTGGTEERITAPAPAARAPLSTRWLPLLSVSVEELDRLSFSHENLQIACAAAFVKSDIQSLG